MIDSVEEEANMLDRHLEILQTVVADEPIGIVNLSDELDHAHHEVRYSLRILQEENLINPTKQGAVTTDQTDPFIETLDAQIDDLKSSLNAVRVND